MSFRAVLGAVAAAFSALPTTVTATGTQFLAAASASYRATASKLYLQSTTGNNVSSFTFLAKGTAATLDLRNDAASYPNAVRVSVDGGALNIAPNVGSVYTLFTGLSDTWHRVTIQTGTAWGVNNLHLLPSGTALSVTGVDAAWVAPSYWLHPGDSGSLFHTTGALGANVTDYLPANVLVPAVTNTSNVGTVRFRAAATKLFIYSNTNCLFYSRNGGAPVRVPVTANTGTVIEGFDGTEATYSVWSNGGRFVSVGTDAPLVDVGAKKRMDQFGDSITAADSVAGTADQNRGDSDVLGVAAALGFAGATYGISGQTIAALKTNIVTQLAALPAAGPLDVAVLAIGRNNLVGDMDATEQADYSAIIDSLLAKGYGRVLCRGVLPDSQVWTAFNATMSSVVAAKADARAVYINTNSWTGIANGDGTHPTIAGYATIRVYAIAAYAPHMPT
jgi:GDSL-like Lipase/Acylhydrolase family